MTQVTEREPPLTDEQLAVVTAPFDQLTVVEAGAGTGKTHTLVARLAHLADCAGVVAGDELLVLSFSRAAVGEVRKRLRSHSANLPYVPVQTFDSFATSLLDVADPEGTWVSTGYDDRIRAAIRLLETDAPLVEDILTVRHVLIDEAQDLVGIRARFVVLLLACTVAKFTVFTDPAQAIYGYREAAAETASDSVDFVASLGQVAGGRPIARLVLSTQLRAGSEATRRVMLLGPKLADPSVDSTSLAAELHDLLESLLPVESLRAMRRLLTRASERTTAILCRTNAQALLLADELTAMGVGYRLQRQTAERVVGGWLAQVATWVDGHLLSQRRFIELADQVSDAPPMPPEALWRCLQRLDPRSRQEIDLRQVASRLRRNDIPEELNYVVESGLVVSTIHRSKGLEFDRVVLVPMALDREDLAEANRVVYVGLSRAREEILVLKNVRTSGLRFDRRLARVVRGGFSEGRSPVTGLEVIASDTNSVLPPGSVIGGVDPASIQRYLVESVRPGDPVHLVLAERRRDPDGPPTYQVVHDGNPIGETSERFGTTLGNLFPSHGGRHWPTRVTGARIEMVETVAGEDTVARRLGVSQCGIWARPRLQGLGAFWVHQGGSQ